MADLVPRMNNERLISALQDMAENPDAARALFSEEEVVTDLAARQIKISHLPVSPESACVILEKQERIPERSRTQIIDSVMQVLRTLKKCNDLDTLLKYIEVFSGNINPALKFDRHIKLAYSHALSGLINLTRDAFDTGCRPNRANEIFYKTASATYDFGNRTTFEKSYLESVFGYMARTGEYSSLREFIERDEVWKVVKNLRKAEDGDVAAVEIAESISLKAAEQIETAAKNAMVRHMNKNTLETESVERLMKQVDEDRIKETALPFGKRAFSEDGVTFLKSAAKAMSEFAVLDREMTRLEREKKSLMVWHPIRYRRELKPALAATRNLAKNAGQKVLLLKTILQ